MRARSSHRLAAALLGSSCALLAAPSRADDRAAAQAILSALDPASKDDAIKQAKDALERGTRMRTAGDALHGQLAEGLALEWAQLARDRARAEATESEARKAELGTIDAAARVERERALLEEAIARSGRLRAELASVKTRDASARTKDHTSTSTKPDVATKPTATPAAKRPSATDADAPHPDTEKPAKERR